jgi:hypothetical protein
MPMMYNSLRKVDITMEGKQGLLARIPRLALASRWLIANEVNLTKNRALPKGERNEVRAEIP